MDDSRDLTRAVAFSFAGYPLYLARTLIQIGYEPVCPDEFGRLPNLFNYIRIIREQKGYLYLYTGLKYYLPSVVIKKTSYDLMASVTNHNKNIDRADLSEVIAVCLRESALRIQSTLLTYPLMTLGIGYITSVFFGSEAENYTFRSLYNGIVPKLIVEVAMVWVTLVSRRIIVSLTEDELSQAIAIRLPPFIAQSFLYPLNVVATVMADNGRSRLNPKFDDWRECFHHLQINNQLKRGSSIFFRYTQRNIGRGHSVRRYF